MQYSNIKFPNFQLALYMLSVRAPYPPFPAIDTFLFPLSPQRIRKSYIGMSAIYDTMGSPPQAGVNRTVDLFGISPFTYEIEGTTGWDLHLTDGFAYPGMAAMQHVYDMLMNYAAANRQQMLNNDPNAYTLEFADFFTGEFYQVEPVGEQEIRASERAPLLTYYRFRLAGVRPISDPVAENLALDAIAIEFATSASAMTRITLAETALILSVY